MTGQLLIPPTIVELEGPSIFLAGPIQGAARWQDDAIKMIRVLNSTIHITSPRRDAFEEKGTNYEDQVDWETKYLNRASHAGVILFWLANEHEHVCYRAYAQTTRWELSEWVAKYQFARDEGVGDIRIALGIDSKFSGARYIRHRLKQDCPELPIFDSLQGTCLQAVELANARKSR